MLIAMTMLFNLNYICVLSHFNFKNWIDFCLLKFTATNTVCLRKG